MSEANLAMIPFCMLSSVPLQPFDASLKISATEHSDKVLIPDLHAAPQSKGMRKQNFEGTDIISFDCRWIYKCSPHYI